MDRWRSWTSALPVRDDRRGRWPPCGRWSPERRRPATPPAASLAYRAGVVLGIGGLHVALAAGNPRVRWDPGSGARIVRHRILLVRVARHDRSPNSTIENDRLRFTSREATSKKLLTSAFCARARSTASTLEKRLEARERILETAYELFSPQGIRAVGIDSIVEASGVAGMTLYRHFASKDALVLAFLERREERWIKDWLQREVELRALDPSESFARDLRCLR